MTSRATTQRPNDPTTQHPTPNTQHPTNMRLPVEGYNPIAIIGVNLIPIPAPYSFWRMEETGGTAVRVDSVGGRDFTAANEVDGVPAKIGNGASFPTFPSDDSLWRDGSNALSFG